MTGHESGCAPSEWHGDDASPLDADRSALLDDVGAPGFVAATADSVPPGAQRRPWRRHAAFVSAAVWVESQSRGHRVQITLGPHRYSAAPADAVDLAHQLLAAAAEAEGAEEKS